MATQNNRLKSHGFDLVTADEKVYYSLAADSEKELEDWMSVLGKAIGLDSEEHGTEHTHIHTYILSSINLPYTSTLQCCQLGNFRVK